MARPVAALLAVIGGLVLALVIAFWPKAAGPPDTTAPDAPETTWVGATPASILFADGTTVGLPVEPGDPDFTLAPGARVRFHAVASGDTMLIQVGPADPLEE